MDSGSQKSKVPILPRERKGTRKGREATVSATSARDAGLQTAIVLLCREREGLERSFRLKQNNLKSGGGETIERGQRSEEDQGETESDEESQVCSDLLFEAERTESKRG